jgi:hypothetical protein
VEGQLSALSRRLDEWAGRVREQDRDAFIAGIQDGLERYWQKRAQAPSAAGSPPVS